MDIISKLQNLMIEAKKRQTDPEVNKILQMLLNNWEQRCFAAAKENKNYLDLFIFESSDLINGRMVIDLKNDLITEIEKKTGLKIEVIEHIIDKKNKVLLSNEPVPINFLPGILHFYLLRLSWPAPNTETN